MNSLRVYPLDRTQFQESYDLMFAALGFESRARYIAEEIRPRSVRAVAMAFPDRRVLAFERNWQVFDELGYEVPEVPDPEVFPFVRQVLAEIPLADRHRITIAVDVSSMSRVRVAALVDAFRQFQMEMELAVDFLYAVAQFSPPAGQFSPNAHVGPVLPSFAGWSPEPDTPPVAIIGLGYEQDRALGAVEHLQPGAVWAFMPRSKINEYSPELLKANSILLEELPKERVIGYSVERPFDCFVTLESLVFGIKGLATPVLLPFGPKIFGVLSLLVATIHHPSVAVWRVSPGAAEAPQDRIASGYVYGVRAVFTPADLSE